MAKLELNLDDLEVDSFRTNSQQGGGGVRGMEADELEKPAETHPVRCEPSEDAGCSDYCGGHPTLFLC
jgi:hypothetical protein